MRFGRQKGSSSSQILFGFRRSALVLWAVGVHACSCWSAVSPGWCGAAPGQKLLSPALLPCFPTSWARNMLSSGTQDISFSSRARTSSKLETMRGWEIGMDPQVLVWSSSDSVCPCPPANVCLSFSTAGPVDFKPRHRCNGFPQTV